MDRHEQDERAYRPDLTPLPTADDHPVPVETVAEDGVDSDLAWDVDVRRADSHYWSTSLRPRANDQRANDRRGDEPTVERGRD